MPARGAATVPRPGMNFASRSERAPCFEKMPSVRRTQEFFRSKAPARFCWQNSFLAWARNEFCQQKRAGALLRKNAFGTADAGIRLQGNFSKKLEDADAFAPAKLVPDGIRCHGGQHDVEQRSEETQAASTCECPSSEQQRHRGKRQPHLLGENPSEQYYVSVMEEEFESAMHGWAGSVISGYFAAKGAVCPQWPAMTNSFMGLRVLGAISRSCKG